MQTCVQQCADRNGKFIRDFAFLARALCAKGKYRDAPILYYGTRIGTRHSYDKIITVFFLFATCPDISIQLIGNYRSPGLISALEMQSIARSRRFQSFASESAYHCRVESAISRSAPILRSKYRDSEMLTSQI